MIMYDHQPDDIVTSLVNKQCTAGDRRLFLFGYCAGIPSFHDGIVQLIEDGIVTMSCASDDTRIPLQRKSQIDCIKYTIMLPMSRLVLVDDEKYVIEAWHRVMNCDYSKNPQNMLQRIAYKCWNTSTDILDIKLKIQ
jgi:hypothetical protein